MNALVSCKLFTVTDLFNHEKPLPGNQYFSDKEDGMVCDCLPVVLFYFHNF